MRWFKPKIGDLSGLIGLKMDRLERYLSGTIEMLDPNKNYSSDVEKFTAEDGKQYVIINLFLIFPITTIPGRVFCC